MARGVNKVILIGHLGQDVEVKYMPSGDAVCNLRIATSEQWKDKQTGEKQERTEWHSLVLFGRRAEVAGEYLHKGSKIYVEGKLQTRKWQGKDGQDRYSTEIVVNDMQMLDSRRETFEPDRDDSGGARDSGAGERATKDGGDFDDDIPF